MSETNTEKTDLEILADQVGAEESGRDGALVELAKGMSKGLLELIGLQKAMTDTDDDNDAANTPKGDKGDTDESAGEDTEDGDSGEKPAGYTDLRKGDEDGFIDATEYMLELRNTVGELATMNKAQAGEIAGLRADLKTVLKEQRAQGSAIASILGPMSKGILDFNAKLLDIPEAPVGVNMPRARKKHAIKPAGTPTFTKVQMLKARNAQILDENDVRRFNQHGTFTDDAAKDEALFIQIRAL